MRIYFEELKLNKPLKNVLGLFIFVSFRLNNLPLYTKSLPRSQHKLKVLKGCKACIAETNLSRLQSNKEDR